MHWLAPAQPRTTSDGEEHEPFVQTPSAERVKRKENGKKNRRQITKRRNGRSLQFLAASFIQREATLQRAAPSSALQSPVCFLPLSTHTDRRGVGGGGAGGEGALINEETQESKTGIREAPLEEQFGTRSLALWPCHEIITTLKL